MTEGRTGSGGSVSGEVSVEGLMDELLHSADADAPGEASLGNAARALGVPLAVLGAAAATSAKASAAVAGQIAAGHAAGSAVSGTTVATVSGATVSGAVVSGTASAAGAGLGALGASGWSAGLALSVAKAVSVGLLVGGATIGTVKIVSKRGAGPVPAVVTAPRMVRETPVSIALGNAASLNTAPVNPSPAMAPSPSESGVAEARNDEEPTASAPASGSRKRATSAAQTPAPAPSLMELGTAKSEPVAARAASSSVQAELDALSPARAALRAGNGALALASLREYEARFPSGTLRTEAEVLRVEARLAAEGRDAARAEAARFVARHPNSVHRSRLERLGLLGDAR